MNYSAYCGEIIPSVLRTEKMSLQHVGKPVFSVFRLEKIGFHFSLVNILPEAVAAYQERVAVDRVNSIVRLRQLKRSIITQHLEQA